MKKKYENINRTIWILWLQGEDNAPYLVKKCISSWGKQNPDWDVVILSEINLPDYINIQLPENLEIAHQSDLIRLELLAKFGGVWADATTFCMQPLDDWLHKYFNSGFFMFSNPKSKRGVSNWFIAAEKSNYIIYELRNKLYRYWSDGLLKKKSRLQHNIKRLLTVTLQKQESTTKYWFSFVIRHIFKVYPYFVFHYMLERIIYLDPIANKIWLETGKLSNVPPHLIQEYGMLSPPNEEIIKKISYDYPPMYKLTYRYNENEYSADSILYYLLEDIYLTHNVNI